MYFKIFELHSWGKRASQGRSHNRAGLPFYYWLSSTTS